MALQYAGIQVEHREIALRNKPPSMLLVSPKGTVPVLCVEYANDKLFKVGVELRKATVVL